jgi:hypothetical protein
MDMSPRHFGLLVSLVVFCVASYLLVTASPVLFQTASASLGMPWGTLVAWFGLLSIPSIVYFAFPGLRDPKSIMLRVLRWAWVVSLTLAILYPFLGFYLAGNWSYTFKTQVPFRGSTRASVYYWNLVKITAILPLLVLLGALLERLLTRKPGS